MPHLTPQPSFSFRYGGRPGSELLADWVPVGGGDYPSWDDPETGLRLVVEERSIPDFDAIEWRLVFENRGLIDTPILSDVFVLDRSRPVSHKSMELYETRLARSRGSRFAIDDFEYHEDRILDTEEISMVAGLGRPSQNWLPFFRVDLGGHGTFVAIGWTGEWFCRLTQSAEHVLKITAGMSRLSTVLQPGERFAMPRILEMPWNDDKTDAHNRFRRLILEHYSPQIDGVTIDGPFSTAHWGAVPSDVQIDRIKLYSDCGIRQDHLWVDAGWYGADSSYSPNEFEGDWPDFVGDWRVNPHRHPDGLRPVSDAARAAGLQFILWVEPGRAIAGTPLSLEHPDWFLGDGRELLLDFGNPDAREGIINLISSIIQEQGVDLFREDYNIDPLPYWEKADSPNRIGVTEINYVAGFYSYWDELLRRHPTLIIDNCASGGRRLDLETISRSIALFRSDWYCLPDGDPAGGQNHTMGISPWLPLHGAATWAAVPGPGATGRYRARSCYAPALQMSALPYEYTTAEGFDWDSFNSVADEYLRAQPFYRGDFYPLTDPKAPPTTPWVAYQMDRPDLDSGLVMAFRRAGVSWPEITVMLSAVDPTARYLVDFVDSGESVLMSGEQMAGGMTIRLDPESSSLLFYRKK